LGIRVRIKIQYKGNSVSTVALVNSGYESETPEIHVPSPSPENSGSPLSV